MTQLELIYRNACEYTKVKIYEDIDRCVGSLEQPITFKEYLTIRGDYLEQLWINVWLNKVTNKLSQHHKIQFLSEKGIDVEQSNRKMINQVFRSEIRDYHLFDTITWVKETFEHNKENWQERYVHARERFLNEENERLLKRKKHDIQQRLEEISEDVITEQESLLYLALRHHIAQSLKKDLNTKTKYRDVDTFTIEEPLIEEGPFQSKDFKRLSDFFDELTGNIHKTIDNNRWYFEYEVYYYVYERKSVDYLNEQLQQVVLENLPGDLFPAYEEVFSKPLTGNVIKQSLHFLFDELTEHFLDEIQDEYIEDLLSISDLPFDYDEQQKIFKQNIIDREHKREAELAEQRRKQEEENRMLEDIFGQEYRPSFEKNIRYVLHIGDTNSGKTYQALERMKQAESGLYLAPLRLLALEVYEKLNLEGTPCSLKTGEEEKINHQARHLSSTVEMFYEKEYYEVIVIDEAQMITDKDRGFAWYKAITKANANEVHIIASKNAKAMILGLIGDDELEIREYTRETPLQVEEEEFSFKHVKKGDAVICFSRKRVLETASRLQSNGHTVSMIYGSMPPETRKKQVERFVKGQSSIIVSTDAIGMGLNLPIRRIVFLENEKFDGTRRRVLTSQEVKQIAGRAGRKGIYDTGKVTFTKNIKMMRRLLEQEDEPVHCFAVAPTQGIFERFQKYFRDLGMFFALWDKFNSPNGTKKAALAEERELYERIRGTEIEAKLPIADLYGFLHLPFSRKEPELIKQWEMTMYAIIDGSELPEPQLKNRHLEDLEYSYKAIGLHLLFLYRLDQRTEALYWERVRAEISDHVHERLNTDIKNLTKKCKRCGKTLAWEHEFQICDQCHEKGPGRRFSYYRKK
ncbi:DEAD/DEAH box helicase [Cytobacillus purgationiresistens]|uniref:ATP-dependent RNA helicase SUPV3L1/SUV3 n=1 Tax=Cytobacillus purgationiresistens TaxID=863449 RepID=A0ABU0ADF6_9BACI|nr:DEAD/DEAH box helicase [Cytobacillus purgationiresistens]MDQ0268473.1 ATP-dependent RNA helicase SUPV3L1/SUV3 [Cytobacillus purgationiresistens]